jgi:hypothetical protein
MTEIPIIEMYRGVGIHDFQSRQRIDEIVKPEIDAVFDINGAKELLAHACSPAHAPEARILAAAMLTALSERAADRRIPRPRIALEGIKAAVAGLASHWSDPSSYCRLFDDHTHAAPRPPEFGNALDEYFREAMRTRPAA